MRCNISKLVSSAAVLAAAATIGLSANAAVVPVTSSFFTGDPVTTFNGITSGTEVNGLTVNGITFQYLVGGVPTNGQVIIDGGPGATNNIAPPNIVSTGNNAGTLVLTLPTLETGVGYGFALLSQSILPDATTITLFNGSTNVGSLSYAGLPDPGFTGGFAGISSTLPFNIVDITFDSTNVPAFAADNFVFSPLAATPEPESLALVVTGIAGLLGGKRFFRRA